MTIPWYKSNTAWYTQKYLQESGSSDLKLFVFIDESIKEIDVEGKNSDSETSDCSPRQLCDPEPEEPQYIIISSGEESIVEEENLIEQGV